MINTKRRCRCGLTSLALLACAPAARAVAQEIPQRMTYGVEIAFRSGHADRGFIINDRPVVQPVMWFSGSGTEFSAWSNFALAQTTDGARPRIFELELTHEHTWGHVTVGPAIRMFFYHDALSADRDRSLEGWLKLSYDVGPFQLFTRHSLDVLTYKGAYFVDAGIESEHHLSPPLELGGSLGAGWASARFNDAYAGIATRALDRVSAETWLTVYRGYLYTGAVAACRELLVTHGLFAGGSSGTAFAAIKRCAAKLARSTVLFLCADRGTPYLDTVFNPTWATRLP